MSATIDPSGSQPLPASSNNALPPGTVVGDYTIQGLVGEGGFGIVYRAFDNVMQREIALKEYMPNALARRRPDGHVELRAPQYEATFHAGRRSFVNEARLLAQFDHKALVKVYRFLEANGTAYMVMPLYQGRTLKQILRETPAIDEAWLKSLIAPLLDALETLHGARCFHRDVAPDNILILDSGGPLLLDFGAARRIIGDMTQAVTVVIKPGYAPVEQYADDNSLQQGPWTDIYALAAVVRLAITGKPPATSVTRMVSDPVKPLADIVTGYSPQFLRAVDFGLAVRPEDRPQSIAEFREALGLSTAALRPVTPPPPAVAPAMAPAAAAPAPAPKPPPAPVAPPPAAPASVAPPATAPVAPALKPVPPPLKPEATGPIGETVPMRQHRTMAPAPAAPSVPPAEPKAEPAHPSIPVKPPPKASTPAPVMARPAPAAVATPRRQWVPIAVVVAMMLVVVGAGYFVMQAVTSPPSRDSVARAPASGGAASQAPQPAVEPKPAPSPPPSATPAAAPEAPPPVQASAAPPPSTTTPPVNPSAATASPVPPATPPPASIAPATPPPASSAPATPPTAASVHAAAPTPPPTSAAPPTGRVILDIKPWGDVVVDGRPRGPSPPLKVLQLPEGAHRIEVRNPAGAALVRDVKVTAGGRVEISHTFK